MAEGKFVAYYRVSTEKQGRSGLGLEAQKAAVLSYLNGGAWSLVAEFEEHESGKLDDREALKAALAACRKHKATLVIAKMDRLSRDLAFIANLMKSGVDFVAVDNPTANKLTIHILAAVAEDEREMISARTKAALAAAKARGQLLGNRTNLAEAQAKGREVRVSKAAQFAANVRPVVAQIQAQGHTTLRAIAAELNTRGVKTPRGSEWHPKQVHLLLRRG